MSASNFDKIKKFSEEKYATKKDVINEMKTNLIDGIWSRILEYRSQFMTAIKLKHDDGINFSICLTPTMNARINSLERKLGTISSKYAKLQRDHYLNYYRSKAYGTILREVGESYKVQVDDYTLNGIINESGAALPYDKVILQRYFTCLRDIELNCSQDITTDTFGDFYTALMGTEDLTEYYRSKNTGSNVSEYSKSVILGVKPEKIERSIDDLINFLEYSDDLSLFVKAVCAFYFVYYVKPFESYSEEIAYLFFKKILSYNDIGSVAATLNYEKLIGLKDTFERTVMKDAQLEHDLTYVLDFFLTQSENILSSVLDDMVISETATIRKDYYQADDPIIVNKEDKNIEKVGISEEELKTIYPSNVIEEENKPVVEELAIEIPPIEDKKETILEENKVETVVQNKVPERVIQTVESTIETEKQNNATLFSKNIAISNVPTGLTDEEALRLENHLMSMNPLITHGQAYFYARHCTLGMYYTVEQYKKENGCAYETARKSMNDLVTLGYYKKEMMGKKFVYVPVKRN